MTQERRDIRLLMVGILLGTTTSVLGAIWFFFFQKLYLETLNPQILPLIFVVESIIFVGLLVCLTLWIRRLGLRDG